MKGYKAFNEGWICRGFQYEIGKTYELPEGSPLQICKSGFHFCKNPIDVFAYYPHHSNTVIAEIEALGNIKHEGTKYCTDKIKILREISIQELESLILNAFLNSGEYNTGNYNTGNYNSGNCNSGNYNSGEYNSGNCNSGDRNSGSYNSGEYNSGGYNSGNHNSGGYNSGERNSGNYNSGYYNAGNHNSGHCNSGSYNSGDRNSGEYNSGNRNSGIFNTNEPHMRSFNKKTNITFSTFLHNLDYSFYSLCSRINQKALLSEDYSRIRALPNFDEVIFKELTGIDLTFEEMNNLNSK